MVQVRKQRVIVLALDAASPRLLREWAHDGTLPNLRDLMERGLTGDIRGLDGFFIGSTWPSFYTGVNPGRHGFHYQIQLVPGTYRIRRVADGEPTQVKPFWRTLSDAGRRVAILDVPLSKLDCGINGLQVVEWGVHDDLYSFGASPKTFESRILEKYGKHLVGGSCDAARRTAAEYAEFTHRLVQSIETKSRLTQEILAREPWDFLIQVFSESHCAGHQCWHLHDCSHPAFDAAGAGAVGDPIRRVYRALDTAIGQLAAAVQDATLIVMSAHGMTHWYGATFLLGDILVALGATVPLREEIVDDDGSGALSNLARRAWRSVPGGVRQLLAPLRDRLPRTVAAPEPTLTRGMEAAQSKCFPISNGLGTGGIRLNIVGREPDGVLHRGHDVDLFIATLTEALLSLTDADSGQSLVDRVVRVEEVCSGPALETLPDLVIEWSRVRPIGSTTIGNGKGARVRARHPRLGVIEGSNRYGRTGEHEPGGLFVAAGPGIPAGTVANPASLVDFAPTVCRLLGCSCEDVDGLPISEIVGGREVPR
jgi:predicted AlkP superfamily phosphohydrolase/phosphomutase